MNNIWLLILRSRVCRWGNVGESRWSNTDKDTTKHLRSLGTNQKQSHQVLVTKREGGLRSVWEGAPSAWLHGLSRGLRRGLAQRVLGAAACTPPRSCLLGAEELTACIRVPVRP